MQSGDKMEDLTGCEFERLKVLSFDSVKNGQKMWKCRCSCGNEVIVSASHLKTGHTRSCGCIQKELAREFCGKLAYKHGHSAERLYYVWGAMKRRCYSKKAKNYYNYGGRGIRVCDEWMDYEKFKEWAYSHGYDDSAVRGKTTIDRIDIDGNYCPENCMFISNTEQARNKRNNTHFKYNGKDYIVPELADELGINKSILYNRLYRANWDVDKVIKKLKLDNLIK